jgi:phosphoglycolate phosphatase
VPLIVLWDIDHTLIESSGVSKEIYAAAFASLAGRDPERPARTEGRTDRLILAEMFRDHGMRPPPWQDILPALAAAGAGREGVLAQRGYVLPGVREALGALTAEAGMVSSVLTGNIAANALVKLRVFGLNTLLDMECGAYGEESADRAALVKAARDHIQEAHDLPDVPVVLVGDTPRDVQAALESDAHVVAVASGIHSVDELRAAGAAVALPDLRDTAVLMGHLRSMARGSD